MKKLVVLLTLIATASAFSQGQVGFNNKVSSTTPPIDAPISYALGGPVTAGARPQSTVSIASGNLNFGGIHAMAGLYGGAPGTAESAMTLLVPAVPFRSTSATAGYINATWNPDGTTGTSTRTIQGIDVGSPAIFQIRAWDTGAAGAGTFPGAESFETAAATIAQNGAGYLGSGNIINISSLGGGSVAPSQLIGAAAFSMTFVPEPSIIGLGLLGAVAGMVVFRRRQ